MKVIKILSLITLVFLASSAVFAQGAGIEWNTLNQEALEVAKKNVGPDHPDVAKSLENLAGLYRATRQEKEAAILEQRAAAIRAIKR